MRTLILSVLGTIMLSSVFAQENDSTKKVTDHYFGLQVNALYREVLSFNNNNATINNPYLFTYSFNNKTNGWGMSFGLGYTVDKFTDGDEAFSRDTGNSDFNFRIGLEKKSMIAKKMMVGVAFDILYGRNMNNTTTKSEIDFGGTGPKGVSNVSTEVTNSTLGFGPRISFNYMITDRFMIGTEATYYYKRAKVEQLFESSSLRYDFNPSTGERDIPVFESDETDTEATAKNFDLELPLVLYLTIKF